MNGVPRINGILAIGALLACWSGIQIALNTEFNVHPDEIQHADAICYFGRNVWPPPLNADGLVYSPDGWSRVYNGELYYWLWGRVGTLVSPLVDPFFIKPAPKITVQAASYFVYLPLITSAPYCKFTYQTLRLLNVALFFLYLVWLVIEKPAGARAGLALLLISIPQVIYVYSYSNSDAWSLTVSGALFYFVLQNPVFPLRLSHALAFGSLSALVILAKESFWTILLVASLLLLWKLLPHRHELVRRTTILWLLTWVNSTLLLIAPLKIIYPLSQGNFWGKAEAMRQERAWEAFKPDRISQPGYRLASRNYPFTEVVLNPNWYIYSIQSLYGFFGHLRNPMSLPLYGSASVGFLLQFGLAAYTIYFNWTRLSAQTRTLLWLTFATVIVSVGASLYNSWTYDLQWQGRYLFPILIPLGALLGSLWEYESRRVRLLRAVGWVGLFFLGQYGLWKYVILNPALS